MRALSLLGVILCVVAWAGEITAGAHETGVRHVRCAEHGELTHPARRGAEDAADVTSASNGPAVTGDRAPAAAGHDHCALAVLVAQAVGPVRSQSGVAACIAESGPAMCTERADVRLLAGERLLALAPKTSPPQLSSRV
jgi:hypothetical protein